MIYDNDSLIVQDGDSHTYRTSVGNVKKTEMELSFKGFNGSDTLWLLKSKTADAELQVVINQEIGAGKFKIVLVTPNKEVIVIAEQSNVGARKIRLGKGTSKLKLVGKGAKGTISTNLSEIDEGIRIQSAD